MWTSGCDSVCLGLAIGLVLGFLLIAAIVVVVVIIIMKKRRQRERRPSEGPHVSNIMVTPEKAPDDVSPYEYINPIGVDSRDSLPTESIRLSETNIPRNIESQYITVNLSPVNERNVCYI